MVKLFVESLRVARTKVQAGPGKLDSFLNASHLTKDSDLLRRAGTNLYFPNFMISHLDSLGR